MQQQQPIVLLLTHHLHMQSVMICISACCLHPHQRIMQHASSWSVTSALLPYRDAMRTCASAALMHLHIPNVIACIVHEYVHAAVTATMHALALGRRCECQPVYVVIVSVPVLLAPKYSDCGLHVNAPVLQRIITPIMARLNCIMLATEDYIHYYQQAALRATPANCRFIKRQVTSNNLTCLYTSSD